MKYRDMLGFSKKQPKKKVVKKRKPSITEGLKNKRGRTKLEINVVEVFDKYYLNQVANFTRGKDNLYNKIIKLNWNFLL